MMAGLPGTGIGGLFYLLSALWMPLHELVRTWRGQSNAQRWSVVGVQMGMAAGIMVGIWATGWLLGFLLSAPLPTSLAADDGLGVPAGQPSNVLRLAAILMTSVTLTSVLLGVQVLRLICRRRDGKHPVTPGMPPSSVRVNV